jgi:hypothetical protein
MEDHHWPAWFMILNGVIVGGLILVAWIKNLDGARPQDPGSLKRIPENQIRNNDLE